MKWYEMGDRAEERIVPPMEVEKNNGSQDWICDSCVHKWNCYLFVTAFNGGLVIKHCKEHMTKEESEKAWRDLFGEG